VEFHYTALSLVAPEKNRFKYRLEGLERDWVEAGGQRVATYPRLPPGHYQFRVIAANNDGLWNETGAAFRFTVRPAFWQTGGSSRQGAGAGGGGWVRHDSVRGSGCIASRKTRFEKERTRIAQTPRRAGRQPHAHRAAPSWAGNIVSNRRRSAPTLANLVTARDAVRAMVAIVWAVNPQRFARPLREL
jgi:hypothetical protein